MKLTRPLSILALAASLACAHTGSRTDPNTTIKLTNAVAGSHRPADEKARDVYRHPTETLEFFGLHDSMTVVELFPGRGWFTAVLAPVLAEKGHLIEPIVDPNGPEDAEGVKYAKAFKERLAAHPEVYAKVDIRLQEKPTTFDLGDPATADMVVTFRNLHNLKPDDMNALLDAVHSVLKPGGVFGIEEHRGKPDADPTKGEDTGYVPEPWLIQIIEAKGFALEAKSEVNANPKDTKDYPEGVWTLPPTFALKEQDREKYAAIGESDRMTLRFVRK